MRPAGLARRARLLPAALFAGMLALYAATLMPGAMGGDAGEMQFVSYILGLAHSPGFPLFMLLAKAWATLVPLGSVAWRVNLLTAVYGAATSAVLAHLVQRITRSAPAALAAGLALGAGAQFWELSVDGDKYTLNALFAASMLLLAYLWAEKPEPKRLYLLAFVSGLSLTHHRSILVLGPLLAIFILWRDPRVLRRPRELALGALALLAPLLLYLYLPWAEARGLPPGVWHPAGLQGWYDYFADVGWTGQIGFGPWTWSNLTGHFVPYQLQEFGWPALALAVLGLLASFRYNRRFALLLLAAYVSWALWTSSYQTFDEDPRNWVLYLTHYAVAAAWVGMGVAALGAIAARIVRAPAAGTLVTAALVLVPLWTAWTSFALMRDLSADNARLDVWRQTLKSGRQASRLAELSLPRLERDAIVVADWEQAAPLWYYQQVEGQRPDMTVLYPLERLDEALRSGRPVYVARALPGLGDNHTLSMAGALIAVLPAPVSTLPADATGGGAVFSDTLALSGYRYEEGLPPPGGVLPVTFFWQALHTVDADYSISLRLLRADGSPAWSEDSQHAVLGSYPTHLWPSGMVIADYHEVPLPRDLPPGDYHLGIVWYGRTPDGGFVNLRVEQGEQLDLPPFRVGR